MAFGLLAYDALSTLINSTSVAIWAFYIATAWAWFRLRKRGAPVEYRTPGGPWVAGGFMASAILVVALAVWGDIEAMTSGRWGGLQALWALLVIASGVVALLVGPSSWRSPVEEAPPAKGSRTRKREVAGPRV